MEPNLNKYKRWLSFLQKVRSFFEAEGFLEVRTPSIVPAGAMESTLDAFKVEEEGYLPTSPEFALKKLWLSGEFDSIFEISPSFRANEIGVKHLSEFTMLEFYQKNGDLEELKTLLTRFFAKLYGGGITFKEICLKEFFKTCTGFEIRPESSDSYLREVCDFHKLGYSKNFSWNDLYQLLFINLIEPSLNHVGPVFLRNYPPQIAALAKINEQGFADRIEVFWQGMELGNGYNELFNDQEILKRWNQENEERVRSGKEPHPVDKELISAHKAAKEMSGVGIAFGLERLFLLCEKEEQRKGYSIATWPF